MSEDCPGEERRNVYGGEEGKGGGQGGGGKGGGQAVVSRSVRSLGEVSGPGFTAPRGEWREGKKWGEKVFHTKLAGWKYLDMIEKLCWVN